jgi:hypothetical protein
LSYFQVGAEERRKTMTDIPNNNHDPEWRKKQLLQQAIADERTRLAPAKAKPQGPQVLHTADGT